MDFNELVVANRILANENVVDAYGHVSLRPRLAARPEVMAVVHAHAEDVLPFSVTNAPLRPVIHSGSFMGEHVPVSRGGTWLPYCRKTISR